jgi:hypothetical protein
LSIFCDGLGPDYIYYVPPLPLSVRVVLRARVDERGRFTGRQASFSSVWCLVPLTEAFLCRLQMAVSMHDKCFLCRDSV